MTRASTLSGSFFSLSSLDQRISGLPNAAGASVVSAPTKGGYGVFTNRNQNSRSGHLGIQVTLAVSSTSHLAKVTRQGGVPHGTQPSEL